MKIDKIIFAADDSHFLEFWPTQSKICKEVLGIEPVLFHITDCDSDFYYDEYGLVKKIKKIEFIRSGALAAIGRMFFTKYFPDDVCLIADIDMLLIDKNYIYNSIKNFDDNSLVIYISDAYDTNRPEAKEYVLRDYFPQNMNQLYPYHLNAAKGKTFNKILDTDCSFEEYINRHKELGNKTLFWGADECYFSQCVNNKKHNVKIEKLVRGYESPWKCLKRIERHRFPVRLEFKNEIDAQKIEGVYDFNNFEKDNIVEINCPRPYSKFKEVIDSIINLVISTKKNMNNGMLNLGIKYGTDKVLHHRFDKIYEKFLNSLKDEKIKLFEIGCGSEFASFNMWKEYFHNGQIYSMDINEEKITDNGIVFKGDQNNKDDLQKMINLIGECDIIIDDGSHVPEHQINTFNFLFDKMLKNGGIYIIEDIECNYWNPKNTIYGYEVGNHNVVDYFSTVPHKINSEFSGMRNNNLISSITYFKNCIILTKMDVEEIKEKDREYRFKEML